MTEEKRNYDLEEVSERRAKIRGGLFDSTFYIGNSTFYIAVYDKENIS